MNFKNWIPSRIPHLHSTSIVKSFLYDQPGTIAYRTIRPIKVLYSSDIDPVNLV